MKTILVDIDDTLIPTVTHYANKCLSQEEHYKIGTLARLKSIFTSEGWREFANIYDDIRNELLDRKDVQEWIKFLLKESYDRLDSDDARIFIRSNLPPSKETFDRIVSTLRSFAELLSIPIQEISFLESMDFNVFGRCNTGLVVDDSPARLMEAYEFENWSVLKITRPWNVCVKIDYLEFPFHIRQT